MDGNSLIGLTVENAQKLLADNGITNVQVVYYTDRKQDCFDTHIVVRVKVIDCQYQLLVCPMQMAVTDLGEQ